jgi:hypothetical protein
MDSVREWRQFAHFSKSPGEQPNMPTN